MKDKVLTLSAIAFSGTLALNAATVWSQTAPGGTQGASGQRSAEPSGVTEREKVRPKAQRDAEGGRPWGQTKSTVQGYPKYTQRAGSNQDVREVQDALREKGYNPGPADGVMGPRTQQALREFQQANNNLKATGNLDAETAAALGVQIDEAARASGGTQNQGGTSAKPRQPRDAEGGEPFLQKEKKDRGQSTR